jgi:hypothetical protein
MKLKIIGIIGIISGVLFWDSVALGQGKKKRNENVRQKFLTGEAKSKRGSTEIDFDEASIDGRRRDPAGVAITKNNPNHQYDLINLRLRWHPEMIESTATLETGKGR